MNVGHSEEDIPTTTPSAILAKINTQYEFIIFEIDANITTVEATISHFLFPNLAKNQLKGAKIAAKKGTIIE
jgi:hypothetical protein